METAPIASAQATKRRSRAAFKAIMAGPRVASPPWTVYSASAIVGPTVCSAMAVRRQDHVVDVAQRAERRDRLRIRLQLASGELLQEEDEVEESQGVDDPVFDQIQIHVDVAERGLLLEQPRLQGFELGLGAGAHRRATSSRRMPLPTMKSMVRLIVFLSASRRAGSASSSVRMP